MKNETIGLIESFLPAYQTLDVINAMILDAGVGLKKLRVDSGVAKNNLLMQFKADILGQTVIRPQTTETTALGDAYLADLAVGFWENIDEVKKLGMLRRNLRQILK